jgi:hypothetical protein
MPFDINKFVKLPSFLVFVGIELAAVMFYLVDAHGIVGHLAKGVGVVGLFIALAGFVYDKIYVAIIIALLLIIPAGLRAQTGHNVVLAWDASTSSVPTNPGTYSVWRALQNADGTCPVAYTRIASGIVLLTYTDNAVTANAKYCYTATFVHTESGQPVSTESDLSDPPILVTIPGPLKPGSPTNMRKVSVQ